MSLSELVKQSGYKIGFIGKRLGLEPYQISKLLRSIPNETQTRMLSAVLVSQLGICTRNELMKAISRTKELEAERKMLLWEDLMQTVEEDRKKEQQKERRITKSGNSNGKAVRRRASKK